jgi:hypothetical protein
MKVNKMRNRKYFFTTIKCIVVFFLLINFVILGYSQEVNTSIKEKFLMEAPVKWKEYLNHFTKLKGSYVEKLRRSSAPDKIEITKSNILCDYPDVLFESENDDFSYHYCSNEKYSFSLSFQDGNTIVDECLLLGKKDIPQRDEWEFPANERNVNRNSSVNFIVEIVAKGLLLSHKWLPTLINCPDFVIDEIEELSRDGELLVRIKFSNNPKILNDEAYLMNVRHGEVFLYPNHFWLIKSGNCFFWSDDNDSYTIQWTNDYDFTKFTAPQLISQNLEGTYINDPSKKIYREITYDFQPLQNVESNRFTLSYYGIPEPDFGERRTNRVRYILIGLGLLLITIGAYRLIRMRNENT